MDYSKIEGATFVRFKKGDCLVHAGEKPNCFYIVASGCCYRNRTEENGNDTIGSVYTKGSIICALMSYRDIVPKSDIIADSTVCCWKIPRQNFIDAMHVFPELTQALLNQIIDEHLELSSQFFGRKNGETSNLLSEFLLTHAKTKDDGFAYVDKSYTNVKIASYLGVHKVTATRIINVLQKENVIARTSNGLQIVNEAQLQAYASGAQKLKY